MYIGIIYWYIFHLSIFNVLYAITQITFLIQHFLFSLPIDMILTLCVPNLHRTHFVMRPRLLYISNTHCHPESICIISGPASSFQRRKLKPLLSDRYSTVREITKSSSTISATNISSNRIWFLQLHDTIKIKSYHAEQQYSHKKSYNDIF